MILSMRTEYIIEDLKNLEDIFDFSNLDENRELFSIKNKKVISKLKIEYPKKICINELLCFRSKMYAFECGDQSRN